MGSAASHCASWLPLLLLLLLLPERPRGAELTFELPDSARQCFHEDVEQGVKFSLDYQVGSRPAPASVARHPGASRDGDAQAGPVPLDAGTMNFAGPRTLKACRLRLVDAGSVPGILDLCSQVY